MSVHVTITRSFQLGKTLHETKHNETREQKRLAFAGKKKQAG